MTDAEHRAADTAVATLNEVRGAMVPLRNNISEALRAIEGLDDVGEAAAPVMAALGALDAAMDAVATAEAAVDEAVPRHRRGR